MTQPSPAVCVQASCTQGCTTECREAINRSWNSLRGSRATQPAPADPAAALDRVRRAATQWRLAHSEGDLSVAWDEAAITVLALITNPNVTWTDLGFTRPAITGHAVVQPASASRHTVDNLINRAEHHGGLTGDEAAALRDGISELAAHLHDAEGDRDSWAADARRIERQAETDLREAHANLIAAQAEAGAERQRAERAEAALHAVTSSEAILAAALAISDYALTHLGRDLGTIHIEPIAEAGLRAALAAHTA